MFVMIEKGIHVMGFCNYYMSPLTKSLLDGDYAV